MSSLRKAQMVERGDGWKMKSRSRGPRERLRSQKPKTEEPGTGTESTDVSVIRRACLGGPKFTEFPIFQILGNTNPFTNFQSFTIIECVSSSPNEGEDNQKVVFAQTPRPATFFPIYTGTVNKSTVFSVHVSNMQAVVRKGAPGARGWIYQCECQS